MPPRRFFTLWRFPLRGFKRRAVRRYEKSDRIWHMEVRKGGQNVGTWFGKVGTTVRDSLVGTLTGAANRGTSTTYPPSIIALSNLSCLPSVDRMAMRSRGETMRHHSPLT